MHVKKLKPLQLKILDLLTLIIIEQNYKSLKIEFKNNNNNNIWYDENPISSIDNLFNETKKMLELLNNVNDSEKYFYKYMIYLFNNDCNKYNLIQKYIIDNKIFRIIYHSKNLKNKNIIISYNIIYYFKMLKFIQDLEHVYIF